MKKQLSEKEYNLLRTIDFSEIKDEIFFDDTNCIFETNSKLFEVIFEEFITTFGLNNNQDTCNEYGRELYKLHDLIFYSNYGNTM